MLDNNFDPTAPKFVLAALTAVGITIGLIVMRRRWPWALTAWICYGIIVSPLLGFVQSGPQLAADRYTYIACMPFGVLVSAGMFRLWTAWQESKLTGPVCMAALMVVWTGLLVLAVMSFYQTQIWYDNGTFLDHVIKLDPQNAIAYYERGLFREQKGALKAALADYTRAVRFDPEHDRAYNNRGVLRMVQKDYSGALADFSTAIRLTPSSPEAYANRGMIRLAQNDFKRAAEDFSKALNVAPENWTYKTQVEQVLALANAGIKTSVGTLSKHSK